MISLGSLPAFSTSGPSPLRQVAAGTPAGATSRAQPQPAGQSDGTAAAPSLLQAAPGRLLPRGSLVNLSV
jgi:hypothetical protein